MRKFLSILLLSLLFGGNALSKECVDDTLKKNVQTGKYLFTVSNKLYRNMVLDRLDAALWLPYESLKICHVFYVDGLDGKPMGVFDIINIDDGGRKISAYLENN